MAQLGLFWQQMQPFRLPHHKLRGSKMEEEISHGATTKEDVCKERSHHKATADEAEDTENKANQKRNSKEKPCRLWRETEQHASWTPKFNHIDNFSDGLINNIWSMSNTPRNTKTTANQTLNINTGRKSSI